MTGGEKWDALIRGLNEYRLAAEVEARLADDVKEELERVRAEVTSALRLLERGHTQLALSALKDALR